MFHKTSVRVAITATVIMSLLIVVINQIDPPPAQKYNYQYKVGECMWHRHQSKNPDGTYKRNIFKIIDTIEIKGEPYYITNVLNWDYRFNHFTPKLNSATYMDLNHPKYTRSQICKRAIRKDLIEKCIKDKNWEFNAGGMECPTKEQYCKELKEKTGEECWEKK